jgi:hypothetical protein
VECSKLETRNSKLVLRSFFAPEQPALTLDSVWTSRGCQH